MSKLSESKGCSQSNTLNPLDMPSLTTVAFAIIVLLAFHHVLPRPGIVDLGVSLIGRVIFSLFLFSLPLFATLKSFLSAPDRWIKQYNMQPLEDYKPADHELGKRIAELVRRVKEQSSRLEITRCPTLLITSDPRWSLSAFGTFHRAFIAVSCQEIEAATQISPHQESDQFEDLVTMFTHELAHIKHGDNWKYMLAKQVITVFMGISLAGIPMTISDPATVELFFIGAPFDAWGKAITLLVYPLIVGVQVYALGLLKNIREHYADARTAQCKGKNAVRGALFALSHWRSQQSSGVSNKVKMQKLASQRVGGLAFFSRKQSIQERLSALEKGAVLHHSVRRTMFISGFAMGIVWFSFRQATFIYMDFLWIVSILLLGIMYLIPREDLGTRSAVLAATTPTLIFIGLFSSLLLHLVLTTLQYMVSGASYAVLLQEMLPYLVAAGYYILDGVLLTSALILTVPFIRHLKKAMRSGILAKQWHAGQMIIPLSFAVSVYVIISVPLRYYDSSNLSSQAIGIIIVLVLSIAMFSFLTWLTNRQNEK